MRGMVLFSCYIFCTVSSTNTCVIVPTQVLDDEELKKLYSRRPNLAEGESTIYHCKSPDCKGWCTYKNNVRSILYVHLYFTYIHTYIGE